MSSKSSPAKAFEGLDQVFAMPLGQVGHTGPERPNQSSDTLGGSCRAGFSHVQERLERQSHDVGVLAPKLTGRPTADIIAFILCATNCAALT